MSLGVKLSWAPKVFCASLNREGGLPHIGDVMVSVRATQGLWSYMCLMDAEKGEEFGRCLQSITVSSWLLLRIGGLFA